MKDRRTRGSSSALILLYAAVHLFSANTRGEYPGDGQTPAGPAVAVQAAPEDSTSSGLWNWFRENRQYYWNELKKAQVKYWNEVYESKGIRLFLKDHYDSKAEAGKLWADLNEKFPSEEARALYEELRPAKEKFGGLATEYQPPDPFRWYHYPKYLKLHQEAAHAVTQRMDLFDHTPYGITWGKFANNAANLPSRWALRAVFKCDKDLAFFAHLPLVGIPSFLGGMYIYDQMYKAGDEIYTEVLSSSIIAGIEAKAPDWNRRIDYNWAYRDIFERRNRGKLTAPKARQLAYIRSAELDVYYKNAAHRNLNDSSTQEELLGLSLFNAIRTFKESGMPEDNSYGRTSAFRQHPTSEQLTEAIKLKAEELDAIEMLRRIYQGDNKNEALVKLTPEKLAVVAGDPSTKILIKFRQLTENKKYVKALLDLHDKGEISDDEFFHRVEEDMAWEMRMRENKVFGLVPLQKSSDGSKMIPENVFLKNKRMIHLDEIAAQK
jgi:hypothetical protein